MKPRNQRLLVTSVGALLTTLVHVSANGEDVELFVGTGGVSSIQSRPNILLILDDSISMNAEVESQVDYDPAVTYDGTCDSSRVYWDTGSRYDPGRPPRADECGSTDKWIEREKLVCAAALAAFDAPSGGTYTDKMAQFHPAGFYRSESWGDISSGREDRFVECEDDWGRHGDGTDADDVYPRNDEDNLWTDRSRNGISWRDTGRTYTIYDGNYVNWVNGPGQSSSRLEIMQEVAVNLVNSVGGVNIGLMSFNNNQGGLVRHAIEDVSTGLSGLISAVNDLGPDNWTPLSESLYEAHQYFRGGSVGYGDDYRADDDAFDPNNSDVYQTPIEYACQKNHIVLLTDGEPNGDGDADSWIRTLVDVDGKSFADHTGSATCDTEEYPSHLNPNGGQCLDDLAEYLHEADLSPLEGKQNITVHTIGFWIDLPVLEQTAERGGGTYYTADDTGSLTSALTAIVSEILETQTTFVAPAVSVNAFNQTRNLDELYFSVFRPSSTTHWPGNLKKYRIRASDGVILDSLGNPAVDEATGFFADSSKSYWSASVDGPNVARGGTASLIPNPRNVYTNLNGATLTAATNRISTDNVSLTDEVLGSDATNPPTREQVIAFINGLDPGDVDNDGVTDEPRYQLGDPLHSRPATVIYGPNNDDGRIYFATNEGYLHSFDIATGAEKWAFVPSEFLGNQIAHLVNGSTDDKIYGIDGNIAVQIVADVDNEIETDEKVYIFFGMRRGGNFYYGLDVSNPDQPRVLWRLGPDELPGLGQTWSTPVPARIEIGGATQNDEKLVLVFGGGYDTNQDSAAAGSDSVGNAIYIVDSVTGSLLWSASASSDADLTLTTAAGRNADMTYSIPADVKVVDINSDGYADRIYAADMGGQVWRFDVHNGNQVESLITGGVIAQLGAAGTENPTLAQTRRFYNAPDTAFVSSGGETFIHVGIGSGYRSHPNSLDHADRFYAIRDYTAFKWHTQAEFDAVTPFIDTDFVDATTNLNATVTSASAGWKIQLGSGEKVLAEALTFNGEVFFTTFQPGTTGTSCVPALGINREYRVSLFNARPVVNLDGVVDPDGLTLEDRYIERDGSILSRTTVMFLDDEVSGSTSVLGVTQANSTNLNFNTAPRRTFWTQESID